MRCWRGPLPCLLRSNSDKIPVNQKGEVLVYLMINDFKGCWRWEIDFHSILWFWICTLKCLLSCWHNFDFENKLESRLNLSFCIWGTLENRMKGEIIILKNSNAWWCLQMPTWSSVLQAAQPFGFWCLWGVHDDDSEVNHLTKSVQMLTENESNTWFLIWSALSENGI